MDHTPLARWIEAKVDGQRFKSLRQLSLHLRLSQNTISDIVEKGRARPETLIKIADRLGVSRTELFTIAGWLRPEDIDSTDAVPLSPNEQSLVESYRLMPDDRRRVILGLADVLLERDTQAHTEMGDLPEWMRQGASPEAQAVPNPTSRAQSSRKSHK